MLDERMAPPDARPTEDQLRAMAIKAYGEKLAQFCDDQRAYPHQADDHTVANQTWADYHDRLVRNGGHMPMLPEEDKAWRTMGWDTQRAANLRMAIKHVEDGNPPIARRFVDNHLREHGTVAAGTVMIRGYAVAYGRRVARVDVSADDGQSWQQARFEDGDADPEAWQRWTCEVELKPGRHRLAVRAADAAGQSQPERAEQVWNLAGYLSTAWHRIEIEAK